MTAGTDHDLCIGPNADCDAYSGITVLDLYFIYFTP